MVTEYLVEKAIDTAFKFCSSLFQKSTTAKLQCSQESLEEALNYHLRSVKNWSEEISFLDLRKPRATRANYVDLDVFLYPRRLRITPREKIETIRLEDIFEQEHSHFIILGQAGAGKTTSMKYFCTRLLFDESFYPDRFNFPIVLRFRELALEHRYHLKKERTHPDHLPSLIFHHLFHVLGLNMRFSEAIEQTEPSRMQIKFFHEVVTQFLNQLKALVILDGFDELDLTAREMALDEIRTLCMHLETASLVVTSRTGEFVYSIPNTAQYEISPLTISQIKGFANKWIQSNTERQRFLKDIRESPFADTTMRPLTLTHLIAIYERIGQIPEKPKTVYRKVINLLLEEWDEQWSVRRRSKYGNFEADRKFEFLSQIAYEFTVHYGKTVFSRENLRAVYISICDHYGLPKQEAEKVANEIETHTGLFVQSGYEQFEFSHKSLQEYLAAEYIVRLPRIPKDRNVLVKIPNELAIVVSISSNPTGYLCELIRYSFSHMQRLRRDFYDAFVSRLFQEKPDLPKSHQSFIDIAILYSLYISGGLRPDSVASLEYPQDNELAENLASLAMEMRAAGEGIGLAEYYKTTGKLIRKNYECLFRLEKKYKAIGTDIPLELYVTKEFL